MINKTLNLFFVLALHLSVYGQLEWAERGLPISGSNSNEFVGQAVALNADGTALAFSSPSSSSFVGVYDWDEKSSSWLQRGEKFANETNERWSAIDIDRTGMSVVVGSYLSGTYRNGIVKIYDWDDINSNWVQRGKTIIGDGSLDYFGFSVAFGNDKSNIVVGAAQQTYTGYVRIYNWDGSSWIQKGSDLIGNNNADQFGYSVALSNMNKTVIVGAIQIMGGSNPGPGYVTIYDWVADNWLQRGASVTGDSLNSSFGCSVSMNYWGNTFIVGDKYFAPSEEYKNGSATVYEWNDSSWTQKGSNFEGDFFNELGTSVTINSEGNIIGIGAPRKRNSNMEANAGHVLIYEWDGSNWLQMGSQIEGDYFDYRIGDAVDIDSIGNSIIVAGGNATVNGRGPIQTGQLKVYDYEETLDLQDLNSIVFSSIRPNPTNGQVSLVLNTPMEFEFSIVDLNGQKFLSKKMGRTDHFDFNLDMPNGLYILVLRSSLGVNHFKIIKE